MSDKLQFIASTWAKVEQRQTLGSSDQVESLQSHSP